MEWSPSQSSSVLSSLPAIATVIAVLITGLMSYVTMTLSKEQKISEFRQSWIDKLREDLAEFFAVAQAFARATHVRNRQPEQSPTGLFNSLNSFFRQLSSPGAHGEAHASPPFSDEKVGELRIKAVTSFHRIKLRLNPEESRHVELLQLLEKAIRLQNQMIETKSEDLTDVLKAIEAASDYARPVLKYEWKRVKRGEWAFRLTRYAVLILALLVLAFFGRLLIEHVFKPAPARFF